MKSFKVITLCGSSKFEKEFEIVQKELTLKGYIVLSLSLFSKANDKEIFEKMPKAKFSNALEMLSEMHKRKIDMSDEIFVINVGGYIGESTKSEIEYAKKLGKKIKYYEK